MDMNTNVMSTAPTDNSTIKPAVDKASGVQAKNSVKDRKAIANGKKTDKFDAVLEKTQEDKNTDAEKSIPEAKVQLSTPLAAQLAAAVALQAEPLQNDVKLSPAVGTGEKVTTPDATPAGSVFQTKVNEALENASLIQTAGLTAQGSLINQDKPAMTGASLAADSPKTATGEQAAVIAKLMQEPKTTTAIPLSLTKTAVNEREMGSGSPKAATDEQLSAIAQLLQSKKQDDEKLTGTPTVLPAMPLATGNLSIESLLSQNKSSDNNPKTILELLNANTGAATQTNASVPIQAQAMAASLQAATGAIGQANSSVQNIVESVQPMMQQTLPVMQPKNASKADAKDLLDKSGKASSAAEKDNLFSLQDTSMSPLQGVPLKVENQTPMTPLQQQLQNMQQAAKPVDEASTVDAGVTLLKSDEPAKTNKETDDSQSTSQFMTQLTKASDINNTLGAEPAKPIVKDYEIPKQIVEQAKLIKTAENSQMVIKLSPEHLGEMVLKVSVSSNGSVNASFHSDNAEVRTIIENSLVQLRQELQSQGLKVDNVGVYAGLGDSLGQGSQANQQQQAGSQNRHRQVNMEDFEDEVSSIAPINTDVSTDDGIDYRI